MKRRRNRSRNRWLPLLLAAWALASPAAAATSRAAAEVAFLQGLRALQQGDAAAAVARFSTAVEGDPDDGSARYWLGLAHLRQGDAAAAIAAFEASLAAARPPRVGRERVRADLERARRALDRGTAAAEPAPLPSYAGDVDRFGRVPRWEVDLATAAGGDSNPALVADGTTALPLDLDLADLSVGPDGDRLTQVAVRAEVRPVVDRGGVTLGLVARGEAERYADRTFLDRDRFAAVMQLAVGGDPAGYLTGPLGHARVPFAGGRSALLAQAGFTADGIDGRGFRRTGTLGFGWVVREGARAATQLDLSWRREDYDRDGSGAYERSGTAVRAGLSQTFYLGRRSRFFRLGVAAGKRDAGAAFDATVGEAHAALALPFGRRVLLWLEGGVERTDYDHLESNPLFPFFPGDRTRDDRLSRVGAVLTWAATPRLLVTARAARTDRATDLGPAAAPFLDLDYGRTVVAVGIRWSVLGGGGR